MEGERELHCRLLLRRSGESQAAMLVDKGAFLELTYGASSLKRCKKKKKRELPFSLSLFNDNQSQKLCWQFTTPTGAQNEKKKEAYT